MTHALATALFVASLRSHALASICAQEPAPFPEGPVDDPAAVVDSPDLRSDVAAGGAPASGVPEGTVPEGSVPDPAALAEPTRRMQWDFLRHPLSPTPTPKGRRRKSPHRVLPLPSVRSQPGVGLMLGANLSYAYRRRESEPNRVYMILESRVSLKKVQDHSFFIRLRDLLRRKEIFEIGVLGYLDPVFPYYGVANNHNLEGLDLQDQYFLTRVGVIGGSLTYQHPLFRMPARKSKPEAVLRSYVGFSYFVDRITPYPDSLLLAERPAGNLDALRGIIRLGATWDSRDNEWSPSKGSLFDVIIDNAGPWSGSTDAWGRISANFRSYWTLGVDKLVLANRFTFDALWGDPPLVALGEVGGLVPTDAFGGVSAGRGWMRRRYIGRLKAFESVELRFEPVEFKVRRHTLGVGLKGFVDLGVVAQEMEDLPKHFHVSGGTGLSVIWDHFAVLRLDAAFSRESFGIYFFNEHAF